jgi:hypothetical protein
MEEFVSVNPSQMWVQIPPPLNKIIKDTGLSKEEFIA